MGRVLKVVGISGGGLLLAGSGAIETHYAQPLLEDQFHPERKQRESKLRQSFSNKSDQVEYLGRELNEQKKINSLQRTNISSLDKELKKLDSALSDKKKEIEGKDEEIKKANDQLREKEEESERQKTEISGLQGNLRQKENDLLTETNNKKIVEERLDYRKKRLALTKEDILDEKALKISSLNIEIRKIKYKKFEDGKAIFETDKVNGTGTVIFKVRGNSNFPDREEKANYLRTSGIAFDLHSSFDTWEKTISLNRWDLDYEIEVTKEEENRNFSRNNEITDFKITEYFKSQYVKDAFKVLVAIGQMDHIPLCLQPNSPNENLFNFCPNLKDSQDYSTPGNFRWDAFYNQDVNKRKLEIWTNSFKTKDGFLGYWFEKTVEFIRTGTVDFSNFLNPVLLAKNYKSV